MVYADLPKQTTSYRDYTDDRYLFPILEEPFTDDSFLLQSQSADSLLLFTDGAVGDRNQMGKMLRGRFGGFGSYVTTASNYSEMVREKQLIGDVRQFRYLRTILFGSLQLHLGPMQHRLL